MSRRDLGPALIGLGILGVASVSSFLLARHLAAPGLVAVSTTTTTTAVSVTTTTFGPVVDTLTGTECAPGVTWQRAFVPITQPAQGGDPIRFYVLAAWACGPRQIVPPAFQSPPTTTLPKKKP